MSDTARGIFVTFEGIEGSGKTTQLRRLAERLTEDWGVTCVTTREPGGTALGHALRRLLLDADGPSVAPLTELMLYAADRAQHLSEVVEPALAGGEWVLCDRYLDATLAYQGGGRGIDPERILELHRIPPLDRRPDRTLLLDLPAQRGLTRARRRNDQAGLARSEGRFEAESLAFHGRVRDAYLQIAAEAPSRVRRIDADADMDAVAARVWSAVADLHPGREAAS